MRKILIYLLLFYVNLYSQESLKLTYTLLNATEVPNMLEAYLILDNKNSKYYFKQDYTTLKPVKNDSEKFKQFTKVSKKDIDRYFIYDLNSIEELKLLGNEYVKVIDSVSSQNWIITNETKKIDNYLVTKATCFFRGRNWEAWFCKELPFPYGPWKFRGLTGLILEVNDVNKRYNYNLVKIEQKQDDSIEKEILTLLKENPRVLSTKDFIEKNEEGMINAFNLMFEGRENYKVEPFTRNGIELKYEWEE